MKRCIKTLLTISMMSLLISSAAYAEEVTSEIIIPDEDTIEDGIDIEADTDILDVIVLDTETDSAQLVGASVVANGNCGKDGNNVTWSLDVGGTLTISGSGYMESYIEETRPWEAYVDSIINLKIQYGIKNIGAHAFELCENLETISLPTSIEIIEENAFYCCFELENIVIPVGVKEIQGYAFCNCTSLNKIVIPSTVELIGRYYFMGNLMHSNSMATILDGCPFLKTAGAIGSGCNIEYGWTTEIPRFAFCSCSSLESIVITPGIKSICNDAFFGCVNLKKVKIPASVNEMGRYYSNFGDHSSLLHGSTFTYCDNLKTAGPVGSGCNIEYEWKNIIDNAFLRTPITSIIFPDNMEYIGKSALTNTNLTSVIIPSGTKSIGYLAFQDCRNLEKIVIPSSVTEMGKFMQIDSDGASIPAYMSTFEGCNKLKTVGSIGSGCNIEVGWTKEFPESAFEFSEIVEVNIPEGIEKIGVHCFASCKLLEKVTIPKTVKECEHIFLNTQALKSAGPRGSGCDIEFDWEDTIPKFAFDSCKGLEEVIIPDNITTIKKGAFFYCENLHRITFREDINCEEWVLSGCKSIKSIGPLGSGCDAEYGWTKEIPGGVFHNCGAESVVITPGIESIGVGAFETCRELKTISLPDSLRIIYDNAFMDCDKLASITIPSEVYYLGYNVFMLRDTYSNDVTIKGYDYSAAYEYAKDNNIKFVSIGKACQTTFSTCLGETDYGVFAYIPGEKYGVLPNISGTIPGNHKFEGWYTKEIGGERITENSICNLTNDYNTLYAHWTGTYLVERDGNGYDTPPKTIFYTGENEYEVLSHPIREGYDFLGWFSSKDGGNKYTEEILKTINSNIKIYAHWQKHEIKVFFNGIYTGENTKDIEYGMPYGDLPIPVKDGYKFVGWFTEVEGGTKIEKTTICKSNDWCVELYPHWVKSDEVNPSPNPEPDQTPSPNPGINPTPNPNSAIVTDKFSDVAPGKWYVNAVQYAVDNGIMSGTTDTTFEPDKPCTRAMMVTILYSSMGKPAVSGTTPFIDLKANWYKTPVLWAYQNNVTKGQTDTTFAPDKNVARQEMAVFLNSFAKHRGNDISATTDLNKFVDISQLSSWAAPQMQWANANGIINGKGGGKLDPKGNATRAEVAAMIMSFQNKFGK